MSDIDWVDGADPDLVVDAQGRATYRGRPYTGTIAHDFDGIPIELQDYADGNRQGVWQGWYPDGADRYVALFVDNRPSGAWVQWFPNGQLQYRDRYDESGVRVAHQRWDESGNVLEFSDELTRMGISSTALELTHPDIDDVDYPERLSFRSRPLFGDVLERAYPGGPILSVITYIAGYAHGPTKRWHFDGTLAEVGYYRHGRLMTRWS